MDGRVTVLRLGHRPGRDDRMTTHVGLTARALGADRAVFEPDATDAVETARSVTDRFGGPFEASVAESPMGLLREWDGPVVHLTMYGLPVQDAVEDVRSAAETADGDDGLLVVVGAEKVPFEAYERADYNVGVTNQPHSEVAALAVFLDRLHDGAELDRTWKSAERRVVPTETGKQVVDGDAASADRSTTDSNGDGDP
ncbi:tRNA (cytidine(56)-2'-O)-methyltransferase [Halobacteriales archaeon SW_7_71_33]|nr:MAG: tRNA (cytidine(56)-2'-O)-methyltransferase [Halobacteriales archaeon SW_7_71_33]